MKIDTDIQNIENVVTRGVERVFPNEDFLRAKLVSGEQLKIYLGIDPTGPTLHMGHIVVLRKLAQLQKLGHKIILLIGDFTAMIGDPDKKAAREPLTHDQVMGNQKLYKEQASTFLDFAGDNPAEFKYNSEWLGKMNFADVLELSSKITVQQILERDMLKKRFAEGQPIYVHEFMYPLMVAQDSVTMDVDGEVGGNDQTFNMLVGRDLQKKVQGKDKFVIPMKLLVDSTGGKMGKTTGNMLSLLDSADEKFKKIMTWSDGMILPGFELLTSLDLDMIQKRLDSGENPRDIKFDLGHEIVKIFDGEDAAISAKQCWINDVQKDNKPADIPVVPLAENFLITLKAATGESNSQLKRLLKEGAIKINGIKITKEDPNLSAGDEVQIGKKRWYKITVKIKKK